MYECSHTCTYMCMHTHGSLYNLLHFSLIWFCHQNQTQYFSSFPIGILLLFSVSSIFPIFPSILAWLHLIVHFRIDQRKSFQFFLTCHPIIYGFPKQTNIQKKKPWLYSVVKFPSMPVLWRRYLKRMNFDEPTPTETIMLSFPLTLPYSPWLSCKWN